MTTTDTDLESKLKVLLEQLEDAESDFDFEPTHENKRAILYIRQEILSLKVNG